MGLSGHQETLVRFQPRSFVVCLVHSTIPYEPFVTYASSHAEAAKVFGAQHFGRSPHPRPEVVDVMVKISGHQWHRLKVSSVGDVFDADGELLPFTVKPPVRAEEAPQLTYAEAINALESPPAPEPDPAFDSIAYARAMLERAAVVAKESDAAGLAALLPATLEWMWFVRRHQNGGEG